MDFREEVMLFSKDKKLGKKILLVSYYYPSRAHAGGLRILDIYSLIREKCPDVQIDLFTYHRPHVDGSIDEAHHIFDNIYISPIEDLTLDSLKSVCDLPLMYDVIDMQFHHTGANIDSFRNVGCKILFTPMESVSKSLFTDLTSVKYYTRKGLEPLKLGSSLRAAIEELGFTCKADEVVCVSRADAAFLRFATCLRHIRSIDTCVSQIEFADALSSDFSVTGAGNRRCNVLYVAYFGSETNVKALLYYLEHVHPVVKASVPDYVLTVVGRGDLTPFSSYRDNSIEFVGEVPSIAPYIQKARVGIAPAVGGAGFRGKINQYAVLGVPCVAAPIALKGLAYQDGVNIFVGHSPELFAQHCISLLTDLILNDRMGWAARQLTMNRYSWQSKWPVISEVYGLQMSDGNAKKPIVTALVPSYNHGRYIRERIESIVNQTYSNIELIVIDDCSDDDSDRIIRELQVKYGFEYISNKQNSGTPFAAWERICTKASGEYIWVCESDDVAEPTFVEIAVSHLSQNPDAVMFYSNSIVINEASDPIDHTESYFYDVWKETRWDRDFLADGQKELSDFQLRGQTVPNMSSALFTTKAFQKAFRPFLKRLKLTGDWLFVGDIMKLGQVIFSHAALSRFRKHKETSRVRVRSARSQAEFMLTKYHLFRASGQPTSMFAKLMSSDVVRFLYEPASLFEVVKSLLQVSPIDTLRCGTLFFVSTCMSPTYIVKFKKRYQDAKEWKDPASE